jgi:radical SAM protein with 4Fe4S-binding SPASM domain
VQLAVEGLLTVGVLSAALVERSVERAVPLSMQVDLTMRCNERCTHCYRVVEERPELTTDEIRHLLDDLARAGTFYLTFSGGEVFLRPDLFALIEHARARRFDVRLKSNALLITPARAERLRSLGIRQVDVSLYSTDPHVHDGITAVPGSLARTLEGVAHLRAAGVTVKLNCPLMNVNADGFREVRALAERLGVLSGFDPMITARNDGDAGPVLLRIGRPALRDFLSDPRVAAERGACASDGPRTDLDEVPCGAGHSTGYVSAYGDVMPCVAMPIACGNIRDEPFEAIWSRSPAMRRVRAVRVRDLYICRTCPTAAFCSRCPGQSVVEDGDLLGPSRAACDQALVAARLAGSTAIPAGLATDPDSF